MGFQWEGIQPETFAQANPLLTGLQYGAQTAEDMANASIANTQAQYASPMIQAQLANLQQQPALTQAQTSYINQGQLPLAQANAAQIQFMLKNPEFMMQGIPGMVAQLGYIQNAQPGLFGPGAGNSSGNPASAQAWQGAPFKAPSDNAQQMFNPSFAAPGQQFTNAAALPQLPLAPGTNTNQSPNSLMLNPQNLATGLMGNLQAGWQKNIAQANLATQESNNYPWRMMPPQQKQQTLAYAAGAGIPPQEVINGVNKGMSLPDIYRANGIDPNNPPPPVYPNTPAMITQQQRRNIADAELNPLQSFVTNSMAPYSRRIAGFSPLQISQALAGTNKDDQANLIAATTLQPEIQGMRMRVLGGNVAVTQIGEFIDNAQGRLKMFQPLISPDVYKQAQTIVNQKINDAMSAANKAQANLPMSTQQAQNNLQQAQGQNSSSNDPLGIR